MDSRYDTEVKQGATWTRVVEYKQSSGDPVNLTGYSARMQLREAYDSDSAAISLTSAAGIAITPLLGKLAITITATQTAALAPGRYVYDLELEAGGVVTRLLEGKIKVTPEVTR